MRTSKAVVTQWMLILNMLFLAACSLPESKDRNDVNENSTATFSIESIKGEVLETKTSNTFGLTDNKVFSFKVCMKDVNERKSVGGQTFKIAETDRTVSTDVGGCLNWTESLNYNPVADSKYVKIQRTITGAGLHRGTRIINLAVNPWSHGETVTPVIDLGVSKVPNLVEKAKEVQQALKGLDASDKAIKRALWVEDGRTFLTEDELRDGNLNLKAEIKLIPAIQVRKINGDIWGRPLSRGTFKARIMLIHSYTHENKENRVILGQSEEKNYTMKNGALGMNVPVPVAAIPDRGQIFLGLHLEAVDAPGEITPFEGVYILGEYDALKTSAFLRLHSAVTDTPNFTLSGFVQKDIKTVSQNPDKSFNQDLYRSPRAEVDPLKFPFTRIGKESTSRREVIYRIFACVNHGLDTKKVRSQTFKITRFQEDGKPAHNLETVTRKTIHDGCFNWEERIEVDVNQCQHFIRGKVVIANDDLGMNQTIPVMINPWDTFATEIGRDMRHVNKDEKVVFDCKDEDRPRRQIKLETIAFLQSSASYEIDNALNLTYVKHYEVRMDAKSLSYSNLFGGRDDARQNLRDGVYLLRTAIVRNRDYDSENTFVASAEKLVNVTNGQVNTVLDYRTKDLKAVGNRNTLLIDLSPVKESDLSPKADAEGNPQPLNPNVKLSDLIDLDTPIDSPVFKGNIVLHTDETTRTLSPYNNSTLTNYFVRGQGELDSRQNGLIAQIIANGKLQMKEMAAASAMKNNVQYFAQQNNLELINVNAKTADPVRAKLDIKEFGGITDASLGQKLILAPESLQTILKTGKITSDLAAKLCSFWINDYFGKIYQEKGGVAYKSYRNNMAIDCMSRVQKNPETFFQVDRHLSVKQIAGFEFIGGLNEGLSLGTGFSLSNTRAKGESVSHSVATKVGLSAKALNIFSVGSDYSYNLSWSNSNSYSHGNAISVSTSKSMSVAMNMFNITINQYQLCAVVKLNPELFMEDDSIYPTRRTNYSGFLNARLTDEEKGLAVTRGLMLCENQVRTTPITKSENYYVISQDGYNQAQDTGDARNRNFFLALRSDNDFLRFVTAVKGKTAIPLTSKGNENITGHATDLIRGLFQSAAPSAPGMYLIKD